MKNRITSAQAALVACALASTGCQLSAAKRARVQGELAGHSQALTTAVVDALELQPSAQRDGHSALALELAREDQRIEGLPPEPIAVAELLAGPDSPARERLADRVGRVRELLERQERVEERLIEQGAMREEERRATRLRWARWLGGSSLVMGGAIALCVFFPVCIPIFGRILAWLAAKVPSLASALGVVSVKAFDSVVRGVEKARANSGGAVRLHNGPEDFRGAESPTLDTHLSREMDAEHKALVRARKAALNL